MKAKIFISSSWRNSGTVMNLTRFLRERGFEVDAFCEPPRFKFLWTDLAKFISAHDITELISHPHVIKAHEEDKSWIKWCDVIILILPAGINSHMEAAYGVGIGKRLFIWGEFSKGVFDTHYRFAEGLFHWAEVGRLVEAIETKGDLVDIPREP